MTLPPHLERILEPGGRELPEQREDPWRIVWPAGARVPVLEFHEDPLPPYVFGPYLQDVRK
jgi:hypothetical protein